MSHCNRNNPSGVSYIYEWGTAWCDINTFHIQNRWNRNDAPENLGSASPRRSADASFQCNERSNHYLRQCSDVNCPVPLTPCTHIPAYGASPHVCLEKLSPETSPCPHCDAPLREAFVMPWGLTSGVLQTVANKIGRYGSYGSRSGEAPYALERRTNPPTD